MAGKLAGGVFMCLLIWPPQLAPAAEPLRDTPTVWYDHDQNHLVDIVAAGAIIGGHLGERSPFVTLVAYQSISIAIDVPRVVTTRGPP